jgi:serine phosphatase RsbU (regulator of sigma subunit)
MNAQTDLVFKQLTIGDLIIAITDAAFEVTGDEGKAYEIAGRSLMSLLAASAPDTAEYLLATCGSTSIQ